MGCQHKTREQNNMKTYLFDVRDDAEMEGVIITVTLRSYWKKHRHMSDEFYEDINTLMAENGFDELMENTYESPFPVEETRAMLLKLGLKHDSGFSRFMAGDLGAPVLDEDEHIPITTELCKEAIVGFIVSRPGHIQAQFGDDQIDESPAKSVSNWKRTEKRKADKIIAEYIPGAKNCARI